MTGDVANVANRKAPNLRDNARLVSVCARLVDSEVFAMSANNRNGMAPLREICLFYLPKTPHPCSPSVSNRLIFFFLIKSIS